MANGKVVEDVKDILVQLHDKGWTDRAIGEVLDIDRSNIYRWRQGGRGRGGVAVALALRTLLRRKVPA